MTDWTNHHPPHDHPDFDAYLDTLTNDDLTALNATIAKTDIPKTDNETPDTRNDLPEK
jgi:hypothetical protein